MRTHETQILPFADHRALKLYGQFEGGVYNALRAASSAAGAMPRRVGRPHDAVTLLGIPFM
jgi:hypothetical protein